MLTASFSDLAFTNLATCCGRNNLSATFSKLRLAEFIQGWYCREISFTCAHTLYRVSMSDQWVEKAPKIHLMSNNSNNSCKTLKKKKGKKKTWKQEIKQKPGIRKCESELFTQNEIISCKRQVHHQPRANGECRVRNEATAELISIKCPLWIQVLFTDRWLTAR